MKEPGLLPAHACLLELLPVLFNPLHSKVHKLSLLHKRYGCIAQCDLLNGMTVLKGLSDFLKILTVHKKSIIGSPDPLTVFHNGTVFRAVVLSGVVCSHICQMQ